MTEAALLEVFMKLVERIAKQEGEIAELQKRSL